MKPKGILFTGSNVRGILEGRKNQTRRIVKPQPINPVGPNFDGVWSDTIDPVTRYFGPAYPPGKILYVKETWKTFQGFDECKPTEIRKGAYLEYAADGNSLVPEIMSKKWRTPLFMCPWMARIWLEVTDVRVERLQEISEEDAIAEGVDPGGPVGNIAAALEMGKARYQYANLWTSINGPGSWDANSYVYAYTFKRIEKPTP